MEQDIILLLSILIAGLSVMLFLLSIISYSRVKSVKLLIVGFGFLGFTIKGFLLIIGYINQDIIGLIIDFIIILLLYFAVVKK